MAKKKNILATLIISMLAAGAWAETEETLISREITGGGFGGPAVKFSRVADDWAVFSGGRGGWVINHTLVLGGGGYGQASDSYVEVDSTRRKIKLGYGGFVLEYVGFSNKLVHYSVCALLGGGSVGYTEDKNDGPANGRSSFFVAEPGANAELNVIKFFRVNLGVGYRFVIGSDLEGVSDRDLSGVAATLTLKFGRF